jgi:sugar lactone lactonase YvrE
MHRSRTLLAAASATVALLGTSLATAAPAPAAPQRPPFTYHLNPTGPAADDIFPEGIATNGNRFFVGSTTDGTIYRGAINGTQATPFLAGGRDNRTSVTGMKVSNGRLFVAGAGTGRVFAYDLSSRRLVGSWQVAQTGAPTFLNDISIGRDGTVYVTDSLRPVLYRLTPRKQTTNGVKPLPTFVDFTGTPLQYTTGFNVNGIVTSANGKFLVLAKSNSADLFRVRIADKKVTRIGLHGQQVSGDGLVLSGRTLYAVERQGDVGYVVKLRLGPKLGSGRLFSRTTYPTFNDPTTAALVGGRLLVVDSQFGERTAGVTPGPFTVSNVPKP